MKKLLNQENLNGLVAQSTRYFVWDTKYTGFGVEVLTSGRKTFYFRYSRFGTPGKVKIGSVPTMTLAEAIKKVKALTDAVAKGEDPQYMMGKTASQKVTIKELGERFILEYLPNLKTTTQASWRGVINRHITPKLGSLLVVRLASSDVLRLMVEMASTKAAADTTRAVLSSMMEWAEVQGIRFKNTNPCNDVKPYGTKKRQVYLKEEEYASVMALLPTLPDFGEPEKSALTLLLLTGCRKAEIQDLQWSWLENGFIRIPWEFHKTGEEGGEKIIHLSPEAKALIQAMPKTHERVFPNPKGGRCWQIDPLWRAIRKELKLDHIRIHDIRHSYASTLINAGVPLESIQVLMAHASPASTRRYSHLDQERRKKLALEAGLLISAAMTKKPE